MNYAFDALISGNEFANAEIPKEVNVLTLEDSCNHIGVIPDFIKMDIQGAEMDMLKGATETIARDKPKIFLEATTGYNDINVLYNELKKYNYNIYVIGASDMKLMKSLADAVDGNWLAMQE